VIGVSQRRDSDGLPLEILDGLDLAGCPGSGNQGEQRQAAGDREAPDVGVHVGIGLDGDVQGGRGVVDGTADESLHGGIAAAEMDELDIEAVLLEESSGARTS